MNVYDQAHALVRALKESEEYREFQRLRDAAYADDTNRALLNEYKRLQFRMQGSIASGNPVDEDVAKRFQQIVALLQFNADASAFLVAQMRLERILADIYKMLGDVAGIDLDMLNGQA